MTKTFYQLFILLGLIAFNVASTQAQTYTCLGHLGGCSNSAAAIKEIEIYDSDNNLIFKKVPDLCNGAPLQYNVMSTTPSFSLEVNKTYTIKYMVNQYFGNTKKFVGFLDLNGDGDYEDPNEFISAEWGTGTGIQEEQNLTGNVLYTNTFHVHCPSTPHSGKTRIRFRSDLESGGFSTSYWANKADAHSKAGYYGETEEYTINIISDTVVSAKFDGDATAYKNVAYYMKSNNGSNKFDWDPNNDGNYDRIGSSTYNWTFTSTGIKNIKTRAENCAGFDSLLTPINVIDVTKAPIVDFIADVTLGFPGSEINFTDLTENGSATRNWTIYDSFMRPVLFKNNTNILPGTSLKYPTFKFEDKGYYTVCLEAINAVGKNKLCKSSYIKIQPSNEVILDRGFQIITSSSGTIYDNGGSKGDYSGIATKNNNSALLAPCAATKITLNITSFKMADFGDVLFVFDGKDDSGIPLHPLGGFNKGNITTSATVSGTSGYMYVYYVSDAVGFKEGFAANWESELGTSQLPTASFVTEFPDIYAIANTKFINTSTNITGNPRYEWNIENKLYTGLEVEHQFSSAGTFKACLMVLSCTGNDTICSNITAVNAISATSAEFSANNTRPMSKETVKFTAVTDKADQYEWYITPEDGYTFVNGTNKNTKNAQVSFKDPGCYEVLFKAWNSTNRPLTTKTVQKKDYICVVSKCEPFVVFNSASVGVNEVIISENGVNKLVSNTSAGIIGYQDLSGSSIARLKYGSTYDISLGRLDINDPWNARVWLDLNGDGAFTPNEILVQKGPDTTGNITSTITMPAYDMNLSSSLTMRIGIGYNNLFVEPCFANVGEYEDYGIDLIRDQDIPEITILKGDTIVIGKGPLGYYLSADLPGVGYTAMDATEGDITAKVKITTDLEENVVGSYYISYDVKDASGNNAVTKTRIIKVVVDNEDPVITLIGASNMTIAVNDKKACGRPSLSNEKYTELGATAMDNVAGNISSVVSITGNVDVTTTGTYVLTYSVSDASGNTATTTRTINIIDSIAPIINFNGSSKIDLGRAWIDETTICDNYDNNITLERTADSKGFPDPYKKGTYTITYNAKDAAGNIAKTVQRIYTVNDNKAPVIALNSSDTVIHDVNKAYYSIAATATDNYDADQDISILSYGSVNVFILGTYQEMFVAKDLSGNTDTAYRFVKVVDREKPSISGDDVYNPLYRDFNPMAKLYVKDNYNIDSELRPNIEVVASNVNIHEAGVYSITYIVTDLSGNVSLRYIRNVFIGADYTPNVGINDLDLAKAITVFPVPSNGTVTLNLEVNEKVTAKVVNVLGAEVIDLGTVTNGQTVDLSNCTNGIYFVRFTVGSSTTIKKIILN